MQLDRRTFLGAVGATTAAAVAAPLAPAEAEPTVSRTLATDLKVPWGLAFLPNGDALLTERVTAKVHRVRARGGRRVVGTIAGVDTGGNQGEGGLLGCAVSPTFADNRHVFFYLTTGSDNRVIRMTYADGGLSERTTILEGITRGNLTHDGGGLGFGPTGHLFISTGDARLDAPGDPASGSAAQDTSNLVGKTLRLNEDGSVPDDNPFGNEVWTYGHRNVQGFDWDDRGRMWASELGENDTGRAQPDRPGRQLRLADAPGQGRRPDDPRPVRDVAPDVHLLAQRHRRGPQPRLGRGTGRREPLQRPARPVPGAGRSLATSGAGSAGSARCAGPPTARCGSPPPTGTAAAPPPAPTTGSSASPSDRPFSTPGPGCRSVQLFSPPVTEELQ